MAVPSAGFFAVPARFSGQVVARVHRLSGSVWAWRAPRSGDLPSAPCLFVPLRSAPTAARLACAARGLGWRAWVKPGAACAVWASGPLAVATPPMAVKVELPAGVSAASARTALGRAFRALSAA